MGRGEVRRRFAWALAVLAAGLCWSSVAHGYVYWTDNAGTTIGRANLDGSGVNPDFITGASQPLGVAVTGQQVYWTNHGTGTIGVANLDGSRPYQQLISGGSGVGGVAVAGPYVYWADYDSNAIARANLDGSGVNQRFIAGAGSPIQVAVDSGHVYWANVSGSIGRANLDGSGVDQSFISGRRRGPRVDGKAVGVGGHLLGLRRSGVARTGYSLAAGQTATLAIALNRTGRWLLDAHYRLPARLTVAGSGALSRSVRFAYARIRLTLAYAWSFGASATTLDTLTLGLIPRAARLEVRCRGRGCPIARHVIRRPHRRIALASVLHGARIRAGAVVSLLVTARNRVGDALSLTMRDGRAPVKRVRCLPPGIHRPMACAR